MAVADRLITAEEFERMPERPGLRSELVEGRITHMSPPGLRHAVVAGRLYEALSAHVRRTGIGYVLLPAGFKVAANPDSVREPDLAFVRAERFVGEIEGFFPGAPDLAIEVRSPGDRRGPIASKISQYLNCGVRMVWLVNPRDETVTVYRPGADAVTLRSGETVDGGEVIPDFRCELSEIFGSR